MKRRVILMLTLLCLALSAPFPAPGDDSKWVEGEVIVTWRKGAPAGPIRSMAAKAGVTVKNFAFLSMEQEKSVSVVKIPGKTTEELMRDFSSDPDVESVSPNYIIRALAIPDDPLFPQQWGLHNTGQNGGKRGADINAPAAWSIRNSALPGKVAVIADTGIAKNHGDLKANLWTDSRGSHGRDCINNDDDPEDDNGHGTHVAGIIGAAGNNGLGVTGVAWNVKLMAVKMLDSEGSGTTENELDAYNWILAKKQEGVDIVAVNASFGGGGASPAVRDAINSLGNRGILLIAAAGNEGSDNDLTPSYPASYALPNVISVAATDKNDNLASYSNYGKTSVHLAAPGSSVLSAWTSFSPSAGDIFFDDMESGQGKWVTRADSSPEIHWQIVNSTRGGKPTKVWTDGPDQHYPANQKTYLEVKDDINLVPHRGKPLMFGTYLRLDLESGYDFLTLQFSADGGASWETIRKFTGGGDKWSFFCTSIPAKFQTAGFRFRFVFETDGSDFIFRYAGVQIDDTGVGEAVSGYASLSGTSMAAPFVTGAALLAASRFPSDSPAHTRSRILDSADPLASLNGKVVTGGRLNLAAALGAREEKGGGGGGCSAAGTDIWGIALAVPLLFIIRKR